MSVPYGHKFQGLAKEEKKMKCELNIWLTKEDIDHLNNGGTCIMRDKTSNIIQINKEE